MDVQLSGPYRLWHHTHDFEPLADGGTLMRDTVRYALPLGPLGALAHRLLVRRDLAPRSSTSAATRCSAVPSFTK